MPINRFAVVLGVLFALAGAAQANIQITEWMYSGYGPEFIELTNLGASAVDFTQWSYDDDSNIPGTFMLSGFGIVNPGESVLITEAPDVAAFRTAWGLSASVKVLGGNTANIGRNDIIHIYDQANQLVDKLEYNDQAGKGPRTQYKSCTIPIEDLGLQVASGSWQLAAVGDMYGSWQSTQNDLGNPGYYYAPEPGAFLVLASGFCGLIGLIRRRK